MGEICISRTNSGPGGRLRRVTREVVRGVGQKEMKAEAIQGAVVRNWPGVRPGKTWYLCGNVNSQMHTKQGSYYAHPRYGILGEGRENGSLS